MRILFLNPQGNFDNNDSYWTEHPDFGGQLVYVKEIAINIAKLGHQVDIVTRRFDDNTIQGFEKTLDRYDDVENLRIVRIPCGPNQFLVKEMLWEYLEEWVKNILAFYQERNETFDFVTTHYGDGGLAGAMIQEKTGTPFSFTGHSLGAQKMDKLMLDNQNLETMIERYQFHKRLSAERTAMKAASVIFTSTTQERDEQYCHKAYRGAGDYLNPERFVIAPPGANEVVFSAQTHNDVEEKVYAMLDSTLDRDIDKDRIELPYILLASRLDPKKNHLGLVKAYAESIALQEIANIVISLRGVPNAFNDYSALKPQEQEIMDSLFQVIKDYKLKGKISFVNIDSQKALAASYRYFAKKRSIFTLTALYEPFGLAPIEAMCAGLPVAVTKYGGPNDVLKDENGSYGVLLDVVETSLISKGIIQVFKNYEYYQKQGLYRVKTAYTWQNTAKLYLQAIKKCLASPIEVTVDIHPYFETKTKSEELMDSIKNYYFKD